MTKADSTSLDDVHSTSLLSPRLAQLEDQLNHLLACHAFYDLAIRAITSPEVEEEPDDQQWHLGGYSCTSNGYTIKAKQLSVSCKPFGGFFWSDRLQRVSS